MDSLTLILILPLLGAILLFFSPKNYATLSLLHVAVSAFTSLALLFNVSKVLSGGTFYAHGKFLFLDSLGCVFLVLIAVTGNADMLFKPVSFMESLPAHVAKIMLH